MKHLKPWFLKIVVMLPALSLALSVSAVPVFAADDAYPSKLVRVIIPSAPGSSADTAGRVIATKLAERLGKPVIVENRAGAGGVLGTEMAAKAAPDGYTLLAIGAYFSTNPAFYKLPYDPINSFTPIAKLGTVTMSLVVHPSVPANSLKELIALAKQKPGQVLWASSGVGQTQHMAGELFKMKTGTDFKIVNFKGAGPATTDLLGGHSHVTISSLATMLPHIKSGKLRVLGIVGQNRSSFLPEVPSFAESGLPGYEVPGWWGVLATAGTPAPIIDRLTNEIKTILVSDDLKRFFLAQGGQMDYLGPTEFRAFLVSEIAQWQRVVKEANIKIDE
jgi:tripartite-type tricarboxylate transporter receptor subunit TctC